MTKILSSPLSNCPFKYRSLYVALIASPEKDRLTFNKFFHAVNESIGGQLCPPTSSFFKIRKREKVSESYYAPTSAISVLQ